MCSSSSSPSKLLHYVSRCCLVCFFNTNKFFLFLPSPMDASFPHLHLLTTTENNSATFLSSSNPCLDFFFQIVPHTPPETILNLLQQAWIHDPLIALKLVFQLRGVRGTGKSCKSAFYTAAVWLQQHHPATLAANLESVPQFGYFKDLLELVLREVEGPEETARRAEEKRRRSEAKVLARQRAEMRLRSGAGGCGAYLRKRRRGEVSGNGVKKLGYWRRKGLAARLAKEKGTLADRETRIAAALEKDQIESKKAAALRGKKREEMAMRAKQKYSGDSKYAVLHDTVAGLFAEQLCKDKAALEAGKLGEVSLAAKWAPSLDGSYDARTGMCEAIARRVYKKEEHAEYEGVEDEHYAYRARDRLRKEMLVPLRQALQLPELYMSARRWAQLPYERVASVAMSQYIDAFLKHDEPRLLEYLDKVSAGKKKVAAGALLPHEIIQRALKHAGNKARSLLSDLQWKRMVADLRGCGSHLANCLAVCDVSGSMAGTPMEVAIALGLLVSELSEEPWKNLLCTFSADPQLHVVTGDSLADRYRFTSRMDWGMNTDFQKVFDRMLDRARASGVKTREGMVQRLFVFSDMEFDQASADDWETDYMVIQAKFRAAGFGEPPEIVFWNLRDSGSTPVLAHQKGVALVSGFSKNLLKVFMEKGIEEELGTLSFVDHDVATEDHPARGSPTQPIDPIQVMLTAIAGPLFDSFKVVD